MTQVGNGNAGDVLRQMVARLGDAADFHFAKAYVDCIVEEYAGKLATVGTGTCHITLREDILDGAYHDVYECDRCGEQMSVGTVMGESEPPNFCIRCGGRRIEVGE